MIRFGEDVCCSLDAAFRREWIEANGIGGFASGTMNGCNTRRYHGLLVAATKPPVGRFILLSRVEETLILNGHAYELGTNRYPGVIHPQGLQYLKQFGLDPFPTFTFCVDGTRSRFSRETRRIGQLAALRRPAVSQRSSGPPWKTSAEFNLAKTVFVSKVAATSLTDEAARHRLAK
jgi:hypothetical protein